MRNAGCYAQLCEVDSMALQRLSKGQLRGRVPPSPGTSPAQRIAVTLARTPSSSHTTRAQRAEGRSDGEQPEDEQDSVPALRTTHLASRARRLRPGLGRCSPVPRTATGACATPAGRGDRSRAGLESRRACVRGRAPGPHRCPPTKFAVVPTVTTTSWGRIGQLERLKPSSPSRLWAKPSTVVHRTGPSVLSALSLRDDGETLPARYAAPTYRSLLQPEKPT